MKVVFNCAPKPLMFTHTQGMTLFKGEEPKNEVKAELKTEKSGDTFEKTTDCKECKDCCKKD